MFPAACKVGKLPSYLTCGFPVLYHTQILLEVGYFYSTKSADRTFVLSVLPKREPQVRKLVLRSLCGKCKPFISICVGHWNIKKIKNSLSSPSFLPLIPHSNTYKNENKIFLIYKEIQTGSGAKSYMRKGFL